MTAGPRVAAKIGLLGFVFLGGAAGCWDAPCHDGYDAGERFQVTVLASSPSSAPCATPTLSPGDSLTFTAGDQKDNAYCKIRGAVGGAPPFSSAVLSSCVEWNRQLGLQCMGVTATGCSITVQTEVAPYIDRGVNSIAHGTLSVWWYMNNSCSVDDCQDLYDVRIDRLPATDGGLDAM